VKVRLYFAVVFLLSFTCGPLCAQQSPEAPKAPAVVTIQQANDKIRLLANSSAVGQPSEYTLSPGDLIAIDVFRHSRTSRKVRVDQSGYISMPLIPHRIHAAGLTTTELEREIGGLLKARGLVSHPQVSVFVEQRLGQPITIIGSVEHPMVYHAMGRTTLLEALSAAGGLTDTAANHVTITHTSKSGKATVQKVSLRDLIERGDPKANVVVRGGDVITVPRAGIVYVVGAVNRPGWLCDPERYGANDNAQGPGPGGRNDTRSEDGECGDHPKE